MKLNRRQFLQGLAAGIVVASTPVGIRAAVMEEAAEHTELPWGFIVRGRQADLIMLPPGISPYPGLEVQGNAKHSYFWPKPFDLDELLEEEHVGSIELCPWAPYRSQMEHLIPEDLQWRSRNWQPRRWR